MRAGWNLGLSVHTLMPGSYGVGPLMKECQGTSCSIHRDFYDAPAALCMSLIRAGGIGGGVGPAGGNQGLGRGSAQCEAGAQHLLSKENIKSYFVFFFFCQFCIKRP